MSNPIDHEVICEFRSLINEQPVCRIVAELTQRPLPECHTNDSACAYCLSCGVPPQAPNKATASMAFGVGNRSDDPSLIQEITSRFGHVLARPPLVTTCVLRGPEIRKVACKPCQAGGLVPVMVPVFRCPKHGECTLHNTGILPKIKGCATCEDRLKKGYQIDARPAPAAVLSAITKRK